MQRTWQEHHKVLVILAHPDDPEFFCGGTIAKWILEGHSVAYCLLTCGDKGWNDPTVNPKELCDIRLKEQKSAAAELGVDHIRFLNYPDGYLIPDINLRKDITRIIREEKPDIIVTSDPKLLYVGDNRINHPDHRAAGQVVLDAVFPAAGNPMYFPELISDEGLKPHSPKEVWVSLALEPNLTFDVSDYWKIKMKALLEHKSQIGDPISFQERMRRRHTKNSTLEDPHYEEKFRRIVFD